MFSALFLVTGASAIAADVVNDAQLAQAVKAELASKDPEFLQAGEIKVSEGIVTLRGYVATDEELTKAFELLDEVPGVLRVVNRMACPSGNARSWLEGTTEYDIGADNLLTRIKWAPGGNSGTAVWMWSNGAGGGLHTDKVNFSFIHGCRRIVVSSLAGKTLGTYGNRLDTD